MSFFSNFFNVKKTLSPSNAFGDDVLNTKRALSGLGHYKTPDFGLTPYSDSPKRDGLKAFQKSTGLAVDGIIKPGGPTERGLNKALLDSGVGNKLFQGIVADRVPGRDKPRSPTSTVFVPEQKTPEPWFKSSKLPPITGEALSSNERTLTDLLKSSANGSLPLYQADALKSGKDSAIGEYGDLLRQMHKRAPERVAGYENEVMERLPAEARARLAVFFNQPGEAKSVKPVRKKLLTGKSGNDDFSNSGPESKEQATQATTPLYQSSINRNYRDAIANKESKGEPNNGYGARNSQGYLGRYQMGKSALIDSGMKTTEGQWTGKHGVKNEKDFLNNPQAQENAFSEYMTKNGGYLRNNGSLKSIGKTFPGVRKEGIRITKSGLLAAAHRRGHNDV